MIKAVVILILITGCAKKVVPVTGSIYPIGIFKYYIHPMDSVFKTNKLIVGDTVIMRNK